MVSFWRRRKVFGKRGLVPTAAMHQIDHYQFQGVPKPLAHIFDVFGHDFAVFDQLLSL